MCIRDSTNADPTSDEESRDRRFNPWRFPKTDNAKQIVADVIQQLQGYEIHFNRRKRKRKTADQVIFETSVSAIICDLIHHNLSQSAGGVAITRSHRILGRKSRYRPPAYNKKLPDLLDAMSSKEMAYVEQEIGYETSFGQSKQTTVRAGKRLVSRIAELNLIFDDLGVSKKQEVITLKSVKDDIWDNSKVVEYKDTADTDRYRDELHQINEWLCAAQIDYDDNQSDPDGPILDVNDRRLRRIFTRGRFDCGGRLFDGFWQLLGKKKRLESLFIDEEEIIELDYGQMSVRIIYGLCGAEPDADDQYDIPNFQDERSGIKKVFNAMLFADKRLSRMPKGVRQEFQSNHSVEQVMHAIERHHAPISHRFFTQIGHEAQFIESTILMEVLLKLKKEKIVALPIHDAVLVPRSYEDITKDIMLDVFHKHTNVDGIVTVERDD